MKILFIPLDERPCNRKYPLLLFANNPEVTLLFPPQHLLSSIKNPAPIDELWSFVEQTLPQCDCGILSMDMLIYGGLIPSRLHHTPTEELLRRVERLRALHQRHPQVPLYGYDCIMRIPSYDGNQEEPDYYGCYGRRIFELSACMHQQAIGNLTAEDQQKMDRLLAEIPSVHRHDYFSRRQKNQAVTNCLLEAVAQGVFQQFVLPQDDSAVFGVQVLEQQAHLDKIQSCNLEHRVLIYPGADEVGLTLLSKAVCDYKKISPTVFVRYSSLTGAFVIPAYEDRPYAETIKWQLLSAGLTQVDHSQNADFILMVNVPGETQLPASEQAITPQRENTSKRNLLEFVRAIHYYLSQGKQVAVADVAYGNGGDLALLKLMRLEEVQDKLSAYAGWNTNANTLGTTLCFALLSYLFGVNQDFLWYRYLEDCGYQSCVRQQLYEIVSLAETPFSEQKEVLVQESLKRLSQFADDYFSPSFAQSPPLRKVAFPWNRLFEIDLLF